MGGLGMRLVGRLAAVLEILPTVAQRLEGWADKYERILSGAFMRSTLRGRVPFKLFAKEERERIYPAAAVAKVFMEWLSKSHTGKVFLDFPCATGRYSGYPGSLAITAAKFGYRYFGVDGVERAVEFARRRTSRLFRKYGEKNSAQFLRADHEQVLELFQDGEVAIAVVLEWFLHMSESEITTFLEGLKRRMAPGGILLFSVTLTTDNKREDFDQTRTSLSTREIFRAMSDWRGVRIPSRLAKIRFFPESCRRVHIRPERVRNYAFMKPNA